MSSSAPSPRDSNVLTELARDMGLTHVTMIGVGAMIGAGVFVLTGIAAGEAGPALLLVFLFNGLLTSITALAYAELGAALPGAGGGYQWVRVAMPQPTGFLAGWFDWFAHVVACSLYAATFGAFSVEILRIFGILEYFGWIGDSGTQEMLSHAITIAIAGLFTYINYRGAEETGSAETFVTVAKIVIIVIFIGMGLLAVFGTPSQEWKGEFSPFFAQGWTGVLVAMGLTFVAFEGYEIIAQCGEEVKNPRRNIPLSIFLSLAIVVPIYCLVAFVALAGVDSGEMSTWEYLGEKKETAIVEAARSFLHRGDLLILIGGLFSAMSALNATIYSSSRVCFALGRDRALPRLFASVHPKRKTPHWAIFISGTLVAAMAVALPISDIASATSAMFLILFALVNIALINLRRTQPDLARGFRAPLVPILPILAVVGNLALAGFLFYRFRTWVGITFGYIVLGLLVYLLYARPREAQARTHPLVYERTPQIRSGSRILVPIGDLRGAEALIRLGARLARERSAQQVLLYVERVPFQLPLSAANRIAKPAEGLLQQAIALAEKEEGVPTHGVIKLAHNVSDAIIQHARELRPDLLIIGWQGDIPAGSRVFGNVLDDTLADMDCDCLVLRKSIRRTTERVLVPVLEVRQAQLALSIARVLAATSEATVEILHICADETDLESTRVRFEKELARLGEDEVTIRLTVGTDPARSILEEVKGGDLLIMGAPREGILRQVLFGDVPHEVARRIPNPILLVKPGTGRIKSWFQKFLGSRRAELD